jgi:hypothetical protein
MGRGLGDIFDVCPDQILISAHCRIFTQPYIYTVYMDQKAFKNAAVPQASRQYFFAALGCYNF